jgi:hypothetical protein
VSKRKKFFEIATVVWAIALVVLATVHLTGTPAYAESRAGGGGRDGWVDCGDSCAVFCSIFQEGCARIWEWYGCGCTIWCTDGMNTEVLCY